MSASSVEVARNAFRERRIGPHYSGPLHLTTTTSLSVLVAVASALQLEDVAPLEWLTVPLTFMYANLSEYLGHRGPMHHKTRFLTKVFERHSIEHHSFFTDKAPTFDSTRDYKAVLFPPVLLVFFIVGFAVPVGTLLVWLFTANVGFLFILTAVLYFLNYELLHFAYHADPESWIGRLPFMSRLRHHHLVHHNRTLMTRYNFNIAYPICDRLFGTLYRDEPCER